MATIEKIEDAYQSACPHCGSVTAPMAMSGEQIDPNCAPDTENVAVCCNRNAEGCGATGGFARTAAEAIANWIRRVK